MRAEYSLESLTERFEKLVLHRMDSHTLSLAHRQRIAAKFANKSLQELQDIVGQLDHKANSSL